MRRWLALFAGLAAGAGAGTGLLVAEHAQPAATTVTVPASLPAACHYGAGGILPDRLCTPGALNPDVTQATLGKTICVRGWTKTVRPPVSVTGPQKLASMRRYGVGSQSPRGFEFDHLISLELGGAPDDQRNLWPEPHPSSFQKDVIENRLKREICSGLISLETAQRAITGDWRLAP